jgi:hypothetical protein
MELSVAASEPVKGSDGKVIAVSSQFWEDFRELLDPWPEIYKAARRQLRKISA